jgi:hypothetical protein
MESIELYAPTETALSYHAPVQCIIDGSQDTQGLPISIPKDYKLDFTKDYNNPYINIIF